MIITVELTAEFTFYELQNLCMLVHVTFAPNFLTSQFVLRGLNSHLVVDQVITHFRKNSLDPLCSLTPRTLTWLDVVKEARKKERVLTSAVSRHSYASSAWPIKNKIVSFHTTKSIMIHFVVSTWIDLKQIRSKGINQYNGLIDLNWDLN